MIRVGVREEDRIHARDAVGERLGATLDADTQRVARDALQRALLSLALHDDEEGPTSVRDIADRTALPQPYLEQILLALKGAGLVRSKRGVGGGYVLARDPDDIRLSEILAAVDGPISVGDFGRPHTRGACNHDGQCVLISIWNLASDHMRDHLAKYTLADVAAIARGEAAWPRAQR